MIKNFIFFHFIYRVTEKFGGLGVKINGILASALDGSDQSSQTL